MVISLVRSKSVAKNILTYLEKNSVQYLQDIEYLAVHPGRSFGPRFSRHYQVPNTKNDSISFSMQHFKEDIVRKRRARNVYFIEYSVPENDYMPVMSIIFNPDNNRSYLKVITKDVIPGHEHSTIRRQDTSCLSYSKLKYVELSRVKNHLELLTI